MCARVLGRGGGPAEFARMMGTDVGQLCGWKKSLCACVHARCVKQRHALGGCALCAAAQEQQLPRCWDCTQGPIRVCQWALHTHLFNRGVGGGAAPGVSGTFCRTANLETVMLIQPSAPNPKGSAMRISGRSSFRIFAVVILPAASCAHAASAASSSTTAGRLRGGAGRCRRRVSGGSAAAAPR